MALSDKNIIITPNRGKSGDPTIQFSGANASVGAQTIYANVYPFNGGTISFEASAGQLFSISSTGLTLISPYGGQVGIGTASSTGLASNVLAVYGSAHITGNVLIKSTAAGAAGIYFPDGTFQTTAVQSPSSGTAGFIQLSGGSGAFASDSLFFYDTSNDRIGIGTGSPTNTVSAWGVTPAWFRTSNGSNLFEVLVGNATTTAATIGYASSTTNPYSYLKNVGGTNGVAVLNNGSVGLKGTTNPVSGVDVGGNMTVGATYAGVSAAPTNGMIVQGIVGIATTSPLSTLDVNGIISARTAFSTAGAATVASLTSNGAVSGTTGSFSTSIAIGGSALGSYEITANGGALATTANATIPFLALSSTTTNADYLEFINIRNASGGTDWTTAGNRIQERVDSTYMGWIGFNNGNTTVTNNGGISFGTGTSTLGPNGVGEKMRLDSSGRLGIATTAPGSILDVNGVASFRSAISAAGAATVASLVSNGTISTATADTATAASHYYVENASDNIIRPKTLANVRTEIVTTAAVNAAAATTVGTVTSGIWNAGTVTSSGAVTGTVLVSTVASGTAPFTITSTTVSTNLNADLLDGLHLNTSGRANLANEVVRTDANGYIQAGWINTTSGDNGTTAIDRVYASSDGYIRYYTPTNFRNVAGVPTNGNFGTGDLNTATISGMYRFDVPSANTPGFSYGQLLVMHGASDTITQIAGDYATSRLATRSGNPTNVGGTGAWGAWRTLIDTVGGQTISGALTVSSTLTLGAGISFSLANPSITASSYITMSGGLYVSGGTLYSQVVIYARGGLGNDSATSLSITGGTSNITNVTGALNATGEITAYSSDIRLKEDVKLISDPISKVLQLRGVTFQWKQSAVDHKIVQKQGRDVGVIAQEVQSVLPEAVKIAPFDANDDGTSKSGEDYLTVQYEKLTALLIEAVKDQQKIIEDMKSEFSARIAELESRLRDR